MQKDQFLNLSKEDILNLAKSQNIFNQTVAGTKMLNALVNQFGKSFLEDVIQSNPEVLKGKDSDGCPLVERLVDAGYFNILEHCAKHIDLTKSSYDGNKNMLGYLASKGAKNVIFKALENNPSVINLKDPAGATGTERLADVSFFDVLERFAEHIDLTKNSYDSSKNMLSYLVRKGAKNAVSKALEQDPSVINLKDPVGAPGTERLVDAGCFDILEKFAEYIDLTKSAADGSKNMLGYLAAKGAKNAISKALEKDPSVMNLKDPAGAPGIERLADVNFFDVLENFAKHIDLTKSSYDGSKNMLSYLVRKGAKNAVSKALEQDPSVINLKDPVGAPGTERLADAGYFNILENFAEYIDLTKSAADGSKNMLSYLVSKGAKNAVAKALKSNPSVINLKDPAGAPGTERLADVGFFDIIKENLEHIDWSKKTYNDQTTLRYLLKKSSISDGIAYIRAASVNHASTINKELDLIISNDLIKSFNYKEVSSKINKNQKINDMNLLAVLANRGLEKYLQIIISGHSNVQEEIEKPKVEMPEVNKLSVSNEKELDVNSLLEDVKRSKSLIIDKIKTIKMNNDNSKEPQSDLKSQFKSIL